MEIEVAQEVRDPNWVLDRRNNGGLFWRRGSNTECNRVKFRCDVEVLEFLRTEAEREYEEDWSSEDEEDGKHRWRRRLLEEDMPHPGNFWSGVCALVIAVVITYQWLSV